MRGYIEYLLERQLKQDVDKRQQAVANIPAAVEDIDLGGYRGPPTFSKWLKTIFWPFWQFTIFSRFSLPGQF
jgi:hypothetical protein